MLSCSMRVGVSDKRHRKTSRMPRHQFTFAHLSGLTENGFVRERMPLLISVVLNVFLGLAVVSVYRLHIERELMVPTASPRPANSSVIVKTNVVVRRLNFMWQQLESGDYPSFIRNLREIGCPDQTIRDIIIADV